MSKARRARPPQHHEQRKQRNQRKQRKAAWWQRHALLLHTAGFLMLLLAVVPVVRPSSTAWADDDSLYGLQVLALHDGGWEWDYPGASFDPEGKFRPFVRGDTVDGRFYPYIRHPVQALVLFGATKMFGLGFGMYVVSMLGLVVAAAMAWLLAREFEPRAGPLAFWCVAASPLLVHAFVPWAHTTSAALAGAAALVAVRILRHGMTVWRLAGLSAAVGLAALLRSESVLFAVALVAAVAAAPLVDWYWQRRRRPAPDGVDVDDSAPPLQSLRARVKQSAVVVACSGVPVAAALVFENWMVSRIAGGGELDVGGLGAQGTLAPHNTLAWDRIGTFVSEQLGALWRITFSTSSNGGAASRPIFAVVVLSLGFVLAARWLTRSRQALAVFCAGAIAVIAFYVWRMAGFPREGVAGFFGVWPAALIGLLVVPWRRVSVPARVSAITCLLFAGSVYATQYREGGGGGGAEWGGRYLSPMVVVLAAVTAAGVLTRLGQARMQRGFRQGAVLFGLVLVVSPAVMALRLLQVKNAAETATIRSIESVSTSTIAVVAPTPEVSFLVPLSWRLNEDHVVFTTRSARKDLLQALHEAGYDGVTLVFDPEFPPEYEIYRRVVEVTPPELAGQGIVIAKLTR